MVDYDMLILAVTLTFVVSFIILEMVLLRLAKIAFSPRQFFLLLVGSALVFCGVYNTLVLIFGWNWYALASLIFLFFNLLLWLLELSTDTALSETMKLPFVIDAPYEWNFFRGGRMRGRAKFFQLDESYSAIELIKLIAKMKIMDAPKQFKTEKDKARFEAMKIAYQTYLKEIVSWKVSVLAYFQPPDVRYALKRVIYVHKYDIKEMGQLQGNTVEMPTREKIKGRWFDTYVVFAGQKNKEVSAMVQACSALLDPLIQTNTAMYIEQLENKVGTLMSVIIDYRRQAETTRSLNAMADVDIDSRKKLPPSAMDKTYKLIKWIAGILIGLFTLYIILSFTLTGVL